MFVAREKRIFSMASLHEQNLLEILLQQFDSEEISENVNYIQWVTSDRIQMISYN